MIEDLLYALEQALVTGEDYRQDRLRANPNPSYYTMRDANTRFERALQSVIDERVNLALASRTVK